MERLAAWLRCGIVGAIVGVLALVSSAASASEQCRFMPLGEDTVADAPQLEPGSSWTYSAGTGASRIELQAIENGVARYRVGDGEVLHERIDAYAMPNRLRKGEKRLLTFPLKVGAQWEDHFSEPGAIVGAFGHYHYGYEEIAYNVVTGIEDVDIGIGRIPTFRVERVASWRKSAPGSEDMAGQVQEGDGSVAGTDRIVSWYAPAVGRVVLRTQMTYGIGYPLPSQGEDDVGRLVRVTELVAYRRPDGCETTGEPRRAQREEDGLFPGFALRSNDSWEYRFQRDVHCPAGEVVPADPHGLGPRNPVDVLQANLGAVRSCPIR
jgi:hypothetical protein